MKLTHRTVNGTHQRMHSRISTAKLDAIFETNRALEIKNDCDELEAYKPLVVGTANTGRRHPELFERLARMNCQFFLKAEPHSPAHLIEEATSMYRAHDCDSVITVGGGSSIGIGKALSLTDEAIFIALPTTYSGSEATAITGRRVNGEKRTTIDDCCRPARIIYDPLLSKTLPIEVSLGSAANCMAHAVDAMYAADAGPVTAALARKVLETIRDNLPILERAPEDITIRENLLVAGFLGGTLVSMHGIALHHQLCHVIGGIYGTPHGANNIAVLPNAVAYNQGAVPEADKLLSHVFQSTCPANAIFNFFTEVSGDTSLSRFNLPVNAVSRIVARQMDHSGYNPRAMDEVSLERCVRSAIEGTPPNITDEAPRLPSTCTNQP